MTAQLCSFTERGGTEQAGIAGIYQRLSKELFRDLFLSLPRPEPPAAGTCVAVNAAFSVTHLGPEDPHLVPWSFLSSSTLMFINNGCIVFTIIAKRTSNLINGLCNYLCSLSSGLFWGITQQFPTSSGLWICSRGFVPRYGVWEFLQSLAHFLPFPTPLRIFHN